MLERPQPTKTQNLNTGEQSCPLATHHTNWIVLQESVLLDEVVADPLDEGISAQQLPSEEEEDTRDDRNRDLSDGR